MNTGIMAHFQGGRINEKNSRTAAKPLLLQINGERDQRRESKFNNAVVIDQTRKLAAPMGLYWLTVMRFEIAVMRLMESNQNGHNLTHT